MSKWIETIDGEYINSSHIRSFFIERRKDSPKQFWIMAKCECLLNEDGHPSTEYYSVKIFDLLGEATSTLEQIIDELERGVE